jgi:hypothetical protein
MNELCLVINTCKQYYKTIDNLISQINTISNNHLFPRENILIVSGQEDSYSENYVEGIKIVKVKYTGLHLTSAIYINENISTLIKKFNYFILLPDTISFGNNFFNLILQFYHSQMKDSNILSFPFVNPSIRPTMDIGIVHARLILNLTNYLNKVKINPPYDINMLKKLKVQLICNENSILGLPALIYENSIKFIYKFPFHIEKSVSVISKNKEDIIETELYQNNKHINQVYFKLLDLYKFQRNFKGLYNEIVMEL